MLLINVGTEEEVIKYFWQHSAVFAMSFDVYVGYLSLMS